MRTILVFGSLLVSLLLPAGGASAQDLSPGALTLAPAQDTYDAELASIDAQSDVATALYVSALVLHIGGLGVGVGGVIAGICIFSCTDADRALQTMGAVGLVASAVGAMVLLPIAIGLDVGSARRRRAHQERTLRVGVSAGGLSLAGSF